MNTNFATAREVTTALSSLGFHSTLETIQTLSRNCRDDFLNHLSRCVTGLDEDGNSKRVIGNLLRSLSPDTISRLASIVPEVTPDKIVPLALRSPAKLFSAIAAATNPQHERHTDAMLFIRSSFAQEDHEVAPTSEHHHQGPADQQQRTPIESPKPLGPSTDRQCAESSKTARSKPIQGASDSKKYHSRHIYGSGYALCFNATEWDGTPGVMVDAAVSDGPKTYDWKNATHIWLDTNEVGAVLAVFRRWRKGIEFAAHGTQNDKSFSIEFQGQHFYAKVSTKKAGNHPTRAVKIMPTDATAVSILFLAQLAESYPAIPLGELLATVRATHQITDATPT